jgi:DNA-binding response OmpR family regulator
MYMIRPEKKRCILLAEDDTAIRNLTVEYLTHRGFEVVACEDGEVAWSHFQRTYSKIDLVLTDITMPRLDGIQLAHRLRDEHPTLPILFVSGYQQDPHSLVFAPDQPTSFLQKPYTMKVLYTRLEQMFQRWGSLC